VTTKIEIDPATQTIIDTFDAHAKKRFAELLGSTDNTPLQATREISFCLGYKAGVVDLGAALREQSVVDVAQLAAVFAAACAWRDSPHVGDADFHEKEQLIAAVDATRTARKEGSS